MEANNEEDAYAIATKYMHQHYNRTYLANDWVTLTFEKIIAVHPAIEDGIKEVKEVYAVPFTNIQAFEDWKKWE